MNPKDASLGRDRGLRMKSVVVFVVAVFSGLMFAPTSSRMPAPAERPVAAGQFGCLGSMGAKEPFPSRLYSTLPATVFAILPRRTSTPSAPASSISKT